MLVEVVTVWCVFGSHNVSYLSVMSGRGMSGRGWNGLDTFCAISDTFEPYCSRFIWLFECKSTMLSSNVGDSEKTGFLLLLAQSCNGSSTTKDAGLVSAFVAPCRCSSCRTLATKRLARGLLPPKAYNLALSWTGTYFLFAMVMLNI